MYWTLKITLFSIGFEWKKSVDLLISGFCLYCDLSLGIINGFNNMKTAKEGSLDVWNT